MMTDTRDPSRRVQFPEAGEGVYLLLRNSGCRTLQNEIGVDWFMAIEKACHFYNIEVMEKMLVVMAHKDEKRLKLTLDDLGDDITMQLLSEKLMDGFALAIHGRTYSEQMEWLARRSEELEAAAEGEDPPPTSPVDSSGASDVTPTGQD